MTRESGAWIGGRAAHRPLGIDIGASAIKAVQVRRSGHTAKIISTYLVEIPREKAERSSPELIAESLKKFIGEHKFTTDRFVGSFPLSSAIVRNAVVPLQGHHKIRQVIKFQAEPHIPFSIEEVVIDFLETAAAEDNKTPVIIIGAKKELIAKQIELWNAAGLDPEILGVDAFALVNNYLLRGGAVPAEEMVMLLDIGATKTLLVIMRGRSAILARSIALGGDDITEALQEEFAIDFQTAEKLKREKATAIPGEQPAGEEERIRKTISPILTRLVSEVDRSMRSTSATLKGAEVCRLYLSGGGALLARIGELLSGEFGCEARLLSSLAPFDGSEGDEAMCAAGVATGLAIQGLGLGGAEVDLRRDDLAYAGGLAKAKRQMVIAAILAVCIVGILMFNFTRSFIAKRQAHAALATELEGIYRETFPGKQAVDAIAVAGKMEQKFKEYQQTYERLLAFSTSAISSLEILREISALVPPEIKAQVTKLEIRQADVDIIGLVNSDADADRIKEALQKSNYFKTVGTPKTKAHGSNKQEFTLTAAIGK